MLFEYSSHESEILNMNVARGREHFHNVDCHTIICELVDKDIDICKMKVSSEWNDSFAEFNKMGFAYHLKSVVYQNKKNIEPEDGKYMPPCHIHYEEYDGSQKEIISQMVREVIESPTGINYKHHLYQRLISPEQEIDISIAYVNGFGDNGNRNKRAWLIRDGRRYVGYFMGEFIDDYFYGTLYGVIPEYRNKNIGKIIYGIMNKICCQEGIRYFINDVQIQNISSVVSTIRKGLMPEGIYFHFVLFPLFYKTVWPIQSITLDVEHLHLLAIWEKLIVPQLNKKSVLIDCQKHFKTDTLTASKILATLHTSIDDSDFTYYTVVVRDKKNDKKLGFLYYSVSR